MSALTEKKRKIDAKIGGQRLVNAKARGHLSVAKARCQRMIRFGV